MIAAFFHDERFTRDASGTWYSGGALPYAALARYLAHFERIVVVARHDEREATNRTVASGPGTEWACLRCSELSPTRYLRLVTARVREVLARVDCAIVRMPSLMGCLASREALRIRTPFLAEVVGPAFGPLWDHGSWKGKLAAAPLALLNRHYVGRAPFAIYVTRATLQRSYPPGGEWAAASDVVIDAPRPDVLARRLARIDARARGAPAALGLVGSYDVAYKGHETALRALAILRRSGRPVTLRCIGVGDPTRWRARAASLGVAPYVELGGALPQGDAVLGWMDALDVLLVPSLHEGLPRALVEAMSRALPAVGSSRGGIAELLEPRALHPATSHRALASRVAGLLDDPAAMRAQAARNWREASGYVREDLEARRDELVRRFSAAVRARGRGAGRPERALAP